MWERLQLAHAVTGGGPVIASIASSKLEDTGDETVEEDVDEEGEDEEGDGEGSIGVMVNKERRLASRLA